MEMLHIHNTSCVPRIVATVYCADNIGVVQSASACAQHLVYADKEWMNIRSGAETRIAPECLSWVLLRVQFWGPGPTVNQNKHMEVRYPIAHSRSGQWHTASIVLIASGETSSLKCKKLHARSRFSWLERCDVLFLR